MKLLVLAALLALAAAAPQDAKIVKILSSNSEQNEDLSYTFGFKSEDGIEREESGSLKLIEHSEPEEPASIGTVMRGSYSYTHEGVTYTVNWIADENGFQPTGAHLPVAPIA